MYSTIIRWQPYTGIQPTANYNRAENFKSPLMGDKFRDFVDAGLVSNNAGPKCYIKDLGDAIEVCNFTWQTQAAAQEWMDFVKILPALISVKVTDEDDNVLASFPN